MKKSFPKKAGLNLLFGIFLTALGVALATNSFAETLTGHVPLDVKNSTLRYHASLNLSVQVILPLQNQSQLSTFLQDVYNPKSPSYHHWTTPAEFNQDYGPSIIDIADVKEFLLANGLTPAATVDGTVLNVTGSSAAFERAFGFHINYYQRNSDGLMFFAPDADPVIPVTLAGKILAVGGLDNLPKYMAQGHRRTMSALPKNLSSGPPPEALTPSYVKTAYNLNSVPATGSGQNVALFELDGYSSDDIKAYESYFGLSNVPLQNIQIDHFNGVPNYGSNGAAFEVTLDIELVTAFAPGTSNILVYEAANTTQAWIDEWKQIAKDDRAKVISCSYGEPEADSPTLNFDNQIFQQMAAQGQAVFVASGDGGAFAAGGNTLSVSEPASQPYATAVGISALATNNGIYSSETASVYGGGGVSAYWSIPSYQATLASQAASAAKVSTTKRNLPDVVLTADYATPYAFIIQDQWGAFYGSSISSPIWASFISRVNQGLGANAPIGSVNSALYQLAQSSSYGSDFHDITTGNNGYYNAEPGFDDATGLGSFNGANLYNDLVRISVAAMPPSVPTGLSATAGNAQVSLSWNPSLGAISYNVGRSTVNGGPYTVIARSVLNTTYTDSSLANGTTYYYVVAAVNSAGPSAYSVQAGATPVLPKSVAVVTDLSGTVTDYGWNQQAVLLHWKQSSSPNIVRNKVYRSTGSSSPVYYGTIFATSGVFDLDVKYGATYNYYVTAVNNGGVESQPSNTITVVMPQQSTNHPTWWH